ncbi:MAG: hypothetical protein JSU63_19040 [Phycisphaerales bacterium]|nr:MAG: hypothetical protein JSU63_19040 [Phycisphaerales bacterium]
MRPARHRRRILDVAGTAHPVHAKSNRGGLIEAMTSVPHPALRDGWGTGGYSAFTVMELLVTIAIIALLAAMLLPSISAAREQAKAMTCRSNIAQITIANTYYSDENEGMYCPGASVFIENLHRWHGTRESPNEPFNPIEGPLVTYLGPDGAIRQCPTFAANEIGAEGDGFERGNGGYGYNNAFIGVQLARGRKGGWVVNNDQAGAWKSRVKRPAETVMFTDSAFAGSRLIEYSFAEPRFHPAYSEYRMDPSIHFRHGGLANVGWCDGHADSHHRTFTWASGFYKRNPDRLHIGWFGKTDDNSLFDLK